MKTLWLLICIFISLVLNIFGQGDYPRSNANPKHQELTHPGKFEKRYEDKNSTKLKLGDREIPINTNSGQMPGERQLEIITNVLTEDFLVNDDSTGGSEQYYPSISMDGSGNFVIVWEDHRNNYSDIYFQRYNSSGTEQGVNTKANDDASAYLLYPSISMDGSGNFVIVWEDYRNNYSDIYFQRYNSSGEAQGVNTKANDDDGSADQRSPSISIDGNGNFVIVWQDFRNVHTDIYFQRYNSSGTAQGVNTKADDDDGSAYQWSPSISMDGSGNFVIVWTDSRNGNYDIYFQPYNNSGIAQGVNTKANDDGGSAGQYSPSISTESSGNFIIVWKDYRNGNPDIYFQRYNSGGTAKGVNTKANRDDGKANQQYPSISLDGSGNFVIVWEDERNGNNDIYFQRYNNSGTAQGVNTKANDDDGTAGQYSPSISTDSSGNFVVVWQDFRDGNTDIYFQRYNSSGTAQGVNTKANDDAGTTEQWSPSISMDGSGNFVIVWDDERNGNTDIYFQRYNSGGTAQGVNTKANDDAGSAEQYSPSISMDGSGNFVIVWHDSRNGNYNIYYQRYNSSGTAQGVNTKANDDAGSAKQYSPSISMDGSGNFVIVWWDDRNGNYDIYYQRYNSSGTAQGVNTKANDDAGSANQQYPSISMEGSGNFVIVWEDYRNGNYDIYFQRYNSSGTAQGVNTKVNDDAGLAVQESSSISMYGSGNFVIVWKDYRNSDPDIYFQRYNSSGTAQGVNTKANDDANSAVQEYPSISMDGRSNFVIVWTDYRYGIYNPDIIGQRYFADGSLNGSNYRIVADGPNYGELVPVVAANNSSIIFSWMDNRRSKSWDIYGKIVNWDWNGVTAVSEEEKNLPEEFVLAQNYPNPFNPTTKIKYRIQTVGTGLALSVQLKVFDVLGNEIATLVNEYKPAGEYEVEFRGDKLSSGVYYYLLRFGSFVETKKMILLR